MRNGFNKKKRNLHRAFVKAKIHLRRHFNIGSNLTAVHTIGQLCHKLLGFGRSFIIGLWRVICVVFIVLGELLHAPLHAVWVFIAPKLAALRKKLSAYIDNRRLNGHRIKAGRVPLCAFLATATILVCSTSYFGIGVEITLDGQAVGFVNSREEMQSIIADVEARTSGYLGRPYNLSMDIGYSLGYVQHDNLLNADYVKDLLFSKVSEVSTQYVLSVDGQIVGANASKTALELVKQRILSSRSGNSENSRAEFVQEISIEQKPVANTYVKTIAEIEDTLVNGTQSSQMYAVQEGDTLGRIAQTYGMTLEQVTGMNPQIDPWAIAPGEAIRVAGAAPLLSVKTTSQLKYTQEIAYETEIVYSDDLLRTQTKIYSEGANGKANVVANVISVDGVEQTRTIQAWDIVAEPVTEIKLVGTKEPPAKAATGNFIIPFRGLKTSSYGYRSRGFHTGVDFAGVKGSPVVAADGGIVIQSGWNGSYGNCVMIDHGNGMVTLYAHNSAVKVKQGQRVAQGETIALLGSTGNSTGPHCHWELRINGKTVNPLNYVR